MTRDKLIEILQKTMCSVGRGHMHIVSGHGNAADRILSALEDERKIVPERTLCQAQGAACISCDLTDCMDRIYGRRK